MGAGGSKELKIEMREMEWYMEAREAKKHECEGIRR
jgi:hypothetical protein